MKMSLLILGLAAAVVSASPLAVDGQAQEAGPLQSWKVEGTIVATEPSSDIQSQKLWLDFTPVSNDFSCKSQAHPNPIVLIHGLFSSKDWGLNFLQNWLKSQGYCAFSSNYGFYDGFPIGGLRPINESSQEIANFIEEVVSKTGSSKVDLVGHSQGAFQALYVAKFRNVSHVVDKIVSIAPPTHGTTVNGLFNIAELLGKDFEDLVNDVLKGVGCAACADLLLGSAATTQLTTGPIVQPGNEVTILASKHDTIVTPPRSAFVTELGATNHFVQDFCAWDLDGHLGLAIDLNVWNIVRNALDGTVEKSFRCGLGGPPVRR